MHIFNIKTANLFKHHVKLYLHNIIVNCEYKYYFIITIIRFDLCVFALLKPKRLFFLGEWTVCPLMGCTAVCTHCILI